MRLPFGFGRRSSSGDGAGRGGAGPGADVAPSADSVLGAGVADAARESRAWADLPPIQRTAGSMPLVAAPGSFARALPGSVGLPPIVQPLGHEVSHLATPGLVVAHARPVAAAAGTALPPPVQRRASRGARPEAHGEWASSGTGADEISVVATPPPEVAPAAPIRSLPTVSRMTIRMPDRPLTSAASAARPASIQRSATGSGSTPTPAAHVGMRRVPAPAAAPVPPTVGREASDSPPPNAAHAAAAAAPEPAVRRGLGAPLHAAPSSALPIEAARASPTRPMPVNAASAPAAMPLAGSPGRQAVQRSPDIARPVADGPSGSNATGSTGAPARLPPLPILPVARAASSRAPSPAAPPDPTPAVAVAATRPTLGARPIEPTVRVQRSVDGGGSEDADDHGSLPSPWWAPAAPAASAGGRGAIPIEVASGPDEPPLRVSRSVDDRFADAPAAGGHDARPAASAHVGAAAPPPSRPVQRAAPPSAPLPRPRPAGPPVSRQAMIPGSEARGAAPVAQRAVVAPPPPTVTPPTPSAGFAAAARPGDGPPAVQRAEDGAAAAAVSTPTSAADGRSESDLEELAQALFSRIRGRLRSDLIHDREAKGLTFDHI